MSLENHKITTYQDNVKDLPDYPSDAGITAIQLKNIFDGRTDKEIKEKFNGLINDLVKKFSTLDSTAEEQGKTLKETSETLDKHVVSETAHAKLFETMKKELAEKIDDSSGANLKNGEGEVSLEQNAWKEEAANSAKGKGAVALGGYNKADAKCSMAVNYDNEVLASNGFAANSGNKIPENCIGAFVAGHQNEVKGEYQAIFGTYADAESDDALVIGNGNAKGKSNAFKVKKTGDVKASGGITSGGRIEAQSISAPGMSTTNMTVYNNAKIQKDLSCKTFTASEDASIGTANIAEHHTSYGKNRVSGRGSAAFGGNNEVKGDTSFSCITSNTIPENLTHVFIAGHANTATGSHQTIVGTYANPKATDRFVVGNGNSAERKNAFAVDSSGNIRIGGNTLTIGLTTITEKQLEKLLALEGFESSAEIAMELQRVASAMSSHSSNKENPHGVTPEQIGAATERHKHTASEIGAASTDLYTATIPTSGWSGSSPYTLDVTVSGMLATDVPIVDIVLPSDTATAKKVIKEWAKVDRITTGANKITVYCYGEVPTLALPIQLKVVR